jgi:hypothetical protein
VRRKTVPGFFALLFFFLPIVVFPLLSACSRNAEWQSVDGARGERIRWTPSAPQIGDLVRVEVFIPSRIADPSSGFLADSAGAAVTPLAEESAPGGISLYWSFRVTRSGTWFWATAEKKQTLWMAPTIAGDAKGIKMVDAQILWSGKKLPAGKSAAAPGAGKVSP